MKNRAIIYPTNPQLCNLTKMSNSKTPLCLLIFLSLLPTLFSLNSHPRFLPNSANTPHKIHVHKHDQSIAESACSGTLYPDLCVSTVAALPELRRRTIPEIISHTINLTITEVRDSAANVTGIRRKFLKKLIILERRAIEDCIELFFDTVAKLKKLIVDLSSTTSAEQHHADLLTFLSAAMTNQYTCLDGFSHSKNNTRRLIEGRLRRISRHFSNSLALVKKIKNRQGRKLLDAGGGSGEQFPEYGEMRDGFPTWLKRSDRQLLQAPVDQTQYDLVVAQDGSGDFRTINEAVSAAPNNSNTRFVIYIKAGAYFEYIELASNKRNIMFLGDGIGNTWIKGDRSVGDGWTTFRSSTVAVVGDNFMAKGITFENYAGPSKNQAVALRSGSDFSAFYQCRFVAYQDTLYVHSQRQFYRDCEVYGTVDFIFGNAAVVLQNCNLYARRPNANQRNVFTAQGREDPNQNTGISILNCKVAAGEDLLPVVDDFRSYLGRPWKEYSRTVYMYSNIEGLIEPQGWLEWDGDFALSTLYYGEYMNRGAGSGTADRVTWPGYRVITSAAEASQFTVANFIGGDEWLPATGIPYFSDLTAP